jgi:hypothetical protein
MSLHTARLLWGAAVVRLALDEPQPEPATVELVGEVEQRASPLGAFRAWTLAQPWRRFCTIVHIISGTIRREVGRHGEA